ncbi:MAG: hypothetical protein LBJ32_02870 [Oscillospiraceae bacterium]|jgi:hypothetical protein|nr:hypothetical protein [Oscillospiraceae bacterium]
MSNIKSILGSVKSSDKLFELINRAKSILKICNLFRVKKFFSKTFIISLATLFMIYSLNFINLFQAVATNVSVVKVVKPGKNKIPIDIGGRILNQNKSIPDDKIPETPLSQPKTPSRQPLTPPNQPKTPPKQQKILPSQPGAPKNQPKSSSSQPVVSPKQQKILPSQPEALKIQPESSSSPPNIQIENQPKSKNDEVNEAIDNLKIKFLNLENDSKNEAYEVINELKENFEKILNLENILQSENNEFNIDELRFKDSFLEKNKKIKNQILEVHKSTEILKICKEISSKIKNIINLSKINFSEIKHKKEVAEIQGALPRYEANFKKIEDDLEQSEIAAENLNIKNQLEENERKKIKNKIAEIKNDFKSCKYHFFMSDLWSNPEAEESCKSIEKKFENKTLKLEIILKISRRTAN